MEQIKIQSTADTPFVFLNKFENTFEISGNSMPEDVRHFYNPIISWLDQYKADPNPLTSFGFNLNYFNSASSKVVLEILEKLKAIQEKGFKVEVIWYYAEDDTDIFDSGKEFEQMVKIPFKFEPNGK